MVVDDITLDYGDKAKITDNDGTIFNGTLVDIEIDWDGSDGGDAITLKMEDNIYVSFKLDEIASCRPVEPNA